MITKLITEEKDGCYSSYYQYIHEPITNNIGNAISDFYNMMHLIKNSLKNKKHILKIKMHDAGYYIYNTEKKREAWVGVFEKKGDLNRWSIEDPIHNYLVFIVYYDGMMAKKIWDLFDDEDDASGIYETLLYSKLNLNDISKEKTEKKQREIIQTWIDKILEKLL